MAVRHTKLGFSPAQAQDAILDGKSVPYSQTSRTGGGSFFRSEPITIGGVSYRVGEGYTFYSFDDGDAIQAEVSGYYSFRLHGGGSNAGTGGLTEASVYLQAGQSVYLKEITTAYTRTGGTGLYLGTVNSLQPSGDRPNSTILVAGGAGFKTSQPQVGHGGGLSGGGGGNDSGGQQNGSIATGGTQSAGGTAAGAGGSQPGGVWYGGDGGTGVQGYGPGGGGGHGWYGGGGGGGDNQDNHGNGGGGSGYVTGVLTTPNTHGNINTTNASTTTGAATNPPSSRNEARLEIKLGAV
jgi:hypothetical protein